MAVSKLLIVVLLASVGLAICDCGNNKRAYGSTWHTATDLDKRHRNDLDVSEAFEWAPMRDNTDQGTLWPGAYKRHEYTNGKREDALDRLFKRLVAKRHESLKRPATYDSDDDEDDDASDDKRARFFDKRARFFDKRRSRSAIDAARGGYGDDDSYEHSSERPPYEHELWRRATNKRDREVVDSAFTGYENN